MTKRAEENRRHWLLWAFRGMLAATVALLFYPLARFLRPTRRQSTAIGEVLAPYKVDELRADAEGHWPAPFDFNGRPCLLIKTEEGEVRAFDAVCTHVDCTVEFRPEKGDIFCNCHNGRFDLSGRNVSGPPPRPLDGLQVTLRGEPGGEEIIVSYKPRRS